MADDVVDFVIRVDEQKMDDAGERAGHAFGRGFDRTFKPDFERVTNPQKSAQKRREQEEESSEPTKRTKESPGEKQADEEKKAKVSGTVIGDIVGRSIASKIEFFLRRVMGLSNVLPRGAQQSIARRVSQFFGQTEPNIDVAGTKATKPSSGNRIPLEDFFGKYKSDIGDMFKAAGKPVGSVSGGAGKVPWGELGAKEQSTAISGATAAAGMKGAEVGLGGAAAAGAATGGLALVIAGAVVVGTGVIAATLYGISKTLDGIVARFGQYNPATRSEESRLEMAKLKQTVGFGQAFQPMMVAWIKIQESVVKIENALMPIAAAIADVVAPILEKISGFLDHLGEVVDSISSAFAALTNVVPGIFGPALQTITSTLKYIADILKPNGSTFSMDDAFINSLKNVPGNSTPLDPRTGRASPADSLYGGWDSPENAERQNRYHDRVMRAREQLELGRRAGVGPDKLKQLQDAVNRAEASPVANMFGSSGFSSPSPYLPKLTSSLNVANHISVSNEADLRTAVNDMRNMLSSMIGSAGNEVRMLSNRVTGASVVDTM